MKHRLAILLVVAGLLAAFWIPAARAHTTHLHTCTSSSHGYQIESGWRHNAVEHLVALPSGGFDRWITATHQQWTYPNTWVTKHTIASNHCIVF
jgi:hypothetical protein